MSLYKMLDFYMKFMVRTGLGKLEDSLNFEIWVFVLVFKLKSPCIVPKTP